MAKKDTRESVERAVLETYQKENPSTYFIDRSPAEFAKREAARRLLFRDLLHFPPKMFDGCTLLDFGAGTGEHTIYYARWGAACTLVEMNRLALDRARMIFGKYSPDPGNHRMINTSLFDYENDGAFDIVVTDGVIHHTADKEGAFARLAACLKAGGYLFLSIGNAVGSIQRQLQTFIVSSFARTEDEIVEVAEALFSEHISRSEKFGNRARRSIIFDSFVNPQHDCATVAEVLQWFADNGLRFYSSWPPILPQLLGDSLSEADPGLRRMFDPLEFPEVAALSEAVWLAHDEDDFRTVPRHLRSYVELAEKQVAVAHHINGYSLGRPLDLDKLLGQIGEHRVALAALAPVHGIVEKLDVILSEIAEALALVGKGDLGALRDYLAQTKQLFRGTCGCSTSYFIAYRPDVE